MPESESDQDRGRIRVIAIVAIIVVVGAAIGLAALITDDGDATLTFDGETATYDGPETIQAGTEVTITLVNTSDELVKFIWLRPREEYSAMTLEEVDAAYQAGENVSHDGRKIGAQTGVPAYEDIDTEYKVPIEGTYLLAAETPRINEQGLHEYVVYTAAIIEATGN